MCGDRDRFAVRLFGSTEQPRQMQRAFHQIARATSRRRAKGARSDMVLNLGAVSGNVIPRDVPRRLDGLAANSLLCKSFCKEKRGD